MLGTLHVSFAAVALIAAEPAPTASTTLVGHAGPIKFAHPPGFTVELVAKSPLVDRPIVADFDARGRLFVADSSGSNDKVEKQLADPTHRIVCLEDANGDGAFDKSTVFADRMMFPEGMLCYAGSVYVAAPPSIWKLTDTDGDGKADKREEWFKGKTLTGCANDLHGPYLGRDGWIYWCKGAFAEQTYPQIKMPPHGKPLVTKAAHIFRCRPDGSRMDVVMTGGMDNPVEVAFNDAGDRFFTTTFLQHPADGKRDGIIHAIYGGLYGKDHHVLDGHLRTGDLMPTMTHLGPAAPSGLMNYESATFGPDYKGNLFAALFNMHKVTRHVLKPKGATYETTDSDFLTADHIDFHPTDVLEDADGSLLVVDTGGWYKLCCPTSQLAKPDVFGAIYRVRKTAAPKIADPRGLKLDWKSPTIPDLAARLDDDRFAVRRRAQFELSQLGDKAVPALADILQKSKSTRHRLEAVWTLAAMDAEPARAANRIAIKDADETVATAAVNAVSLWKDEGAERELLGSIRSTRQNHRLQRALLEALGRSRSTSKEVVQGVGYESMQTRDRSKFHSAVYALLEIGPASVYGQGKVGLAADVYLSEQSNLDTSRAFVALLAEFQGAVVRTGSAEDLNATVWAAKRHPEWCVKIESALKKIPKKSVMNSACYEFFSAHVNEPTITEFLFQSLGEPTRTRMHSDHLVCQRCLKLLSLHRPMNLDANRERVLADLLAIGPSDNLSHVIATVKALQKKGTVSEPIRQALLAVAERERLPLDVRLTAIAAIPGPPAKLDGKSFALVMSGLDPKQPLDVRSAAADALAKTALDAEQWIKLTDVVRKAGPLDVERVLEVFGRDKDPRIGNALVGAIKESAGRRALREDVVRAKLKPFGAEVSQAAEPLFALLRADQAEQLSRLLAAEKSLPAGDVRRGHVVFHGAKANCSACHRLGYGGGNLGPDLSRIGAVRTKRDLLESILFPSASFVRSYEPTAMVLADGRVLNGLVKSDTTAEVVLATNHKDIVRIPRAEIEAARPSNVSIMPAGLEQSLTKQELADLLAFLQAAK